ncbi:Putative uncharacterized protein [Taphrina deformans PYCC 5710]|uniref:YWTD domain-containing protein n=1 Tax=Taphrina deformans (strain PYCC 5710 / ATCC 11124 / CBS 356.35 / IMI 108563 / JCM 9778 / NBRC 8474) TaxID=1097556 RepID=R4XL75_TAPDE|nr:Putative uncharacterized protein [Taphrina deformans PYCC 5710]|eukprot:CCG85140.1 Putative uncharacterized protein [Taphrina deformans PYCC 5710]
MTGKLFYLDPGAKSIYTVGVDGSDMTVIVKDRPHVPDGIVVDALRKHIYWTEMGEMEGDKDDGSIWRSDIDGSNITPIIHVGGTHTPKQLTISVDIGKLWWCDREGMRIMSCNLDGSERTVLFDQCPRGTPFDTAKKDERNHCVGITVDSASQTVYWTQKGPPKGFEGRICRGSLGTGGAVETLLRGLPEPIDLETCTVRGIKYLYWTDRGREPDGNSVNRCAVADDGTVGEVEVLMRGFNETIGLAIDHSREFMYVTDLGGSIYKAKLDGSEKKVLVSGKEGHHLTGIWYADL